MKPHEFEFTTLHEINTHSEALRTTVVLMFLRRSPKLVGDIHVREIVKQ